MRSSFESDSSDMMNGCKLQSVVVYRRVHGIVVLVGGV